MRHRLSDEGNLVGSTSSCRMKVMLCFVSLPGGYSGKQTDEHSPSGGAHNILKCSQWYTRQRAGDSEAPRLRAGHARAPLMMDVVETRAPQGMKPRETSGKRQPGRGRLRRSTFPWLGASTCARSAHSSSSAHSILPRQPGCSACTVAEVTLRS